MYTISPIPPNASDCFILRPDTRPVNFVSALANVEAGMSEFKATSAALAQDDELLARAHAQTGLDTVDAAISLAGLAPAPARAALQSARHDAWHGMLQLTAKSMIGVDPSTIAPKFDSAVNWLNVARGMMMMCTTPPSPVSPSR